MAAGKSSRYRPIRQLVMARIRESYRQPEVLFWVYGFPLVMVVGLGTAFRSKTIEEFRVDVIGAQVAQKTLKSLEADKRFKVKVVDDPIFHTRPVVQGGGGRDR